MNSDKEKLTACQIYADYVLAGCEGMGACGAIMFSDDKRIELHNKLFEAFGIKYEDRDLFYPLTDNLNILKFDGHELKRQIEYIIEKEGLNGK